MTWLELGAPLNLSALKKLVGDRVVKTLLNKARRLKDSWEAYTLIRADKYGGRSVTGAFFWLPVSRRSTNVHSDHELFWNDVHPNAATAHEALWAGDYAKKGLPSPMSKRLSERPDSAAAAKPHGLGLKGIVIVSASNQKKAFVGTVFQWPFLQGPGDDELWKRAQMSGRTQTEGQSPVFRRAS